MVIKFIIIITRVKELLLLHLNMLFPGYTNRGHCSFRVLRDSDLEDIYAMEVL